MSAFGKGAKICLQEGRFAVEFGSGSCAEEQDGGGEFEGRPPDEGERRRRNGY